MINPSYRPDIDGLRAVAVLAVLLFHFQVWPFTGGFVGVDIFFVISGYLISKIILNGAEAEAFSFADFYTRRSRRLLPALLVTIAGTYTAGFFFFAAPDFLPLSRATLAAVLTVSNIFYWIQADYFDTAAILKPLLHTWSLAVEFQFYLVWPAFLFVLARTRSRRTVLIGITLAAGVSFAISVLMLKKDPTGVFYLTPFRIYEFALGGMVVFLKPLRLPQWLSEVLYSAGFAAVLVAVFVYSERTRFPGYAALVPALGAAAMIQSGSAARSASLLQSAPMRRIGAISYSLYLVHWPLWVFTRYIVSRELTAIEVALLIATTFASAFVLYQIVETTFRRPKTGRLSPPHAFNLACVVVSVLIMVPAVGSWIGKGWAWRMPQAVGQIGTFDEKAVRKYLFRQYELVEGKSFTTEKKRIYVIGDSQAADLVNMLFEADRNNGAEVVSGRVVMECGVPYISEANEKTFWTVENRHTIKNPAFIPECRRQMQAVLNSPALTKADAVVIAMLWFPESVEHLSAAVAEIQRHTGAEIYVLGRKDLSQSSVEIVNKYKKLEGIENFASRRILPETTRINAMLSGMFGNRYVDMMSIVCPAANRCHVLTDDRKPIFYDTAHFTKEGASFMGRLLVDSRPAFLR
ncbi:acyltransferase family protein [Microvirga calopogonii]|uniref:acyltransferase family protein n=1 Tax=Microvirga calopogonii TaxID=2078013 RepID=UPI000E0D837B|nr:acyltransferase family protein [Microvirga calopogonii]